MIKFDSEGNRIKKKEISEIEKCSICGRVKKVGEFWVDNTTKGNVCGICYTALLSKR